MPFLTTEQYDRLYDMDYFPQNTPPWEERRQKDAERRLGLIADLVGEDGELLDAGCGEGRMLNIARAHGWKCRGLDVSQPLAKAAEKASGEPVDVGDLESMGYEDYRFVAIYLDSVLEHVPRPAEFARARQSGYFDQADRPTSLSQMKMAYSHGCKGYSGCSEAIIGGLHLSLHPIIGLGSPSAA